MLDYIDRKFCRFVVFDGVNPDRPYFGGKHRQLSATDRSIPAGCFAGKWAETYH
jgi:hypothetical protein